MRKKASRRRVSGKVKIMLVSLAVLLLGVTGAHSSGLLIALGPFGGVLDIEEHEVKVTINNGIAVTEVTQVFRNTENRQVEALYTFPVPKNASVANFSMWINGKEMIGEVVEKKRAREIYESYKQTRRDPGLLEQVDYKTFEMRIFPIGPKARQKVQIVYYQELDFDHDWATYVYPLATTTRPGLKSRTTGKFSLSIDVKSEVPIVKMESSSHPDDFIIAPHGDTYYQASQETTGGDLNRDVVLAYKIERPRTGLDLLTSRQNSEDGYFCLTMTAGEELKKLNQGMDYVFILDISGSMANGGKLNLSQNSIGAFVNSLGPDDRFELITFNIQASTLFNQLTAVSPETQRKAVEYLNGQQAKGGTMLKPALDTAYRYNDGQRQLNVVILSDGMTEQQERVELLRLIESRPAKTRVFCIGVGNEVNRPLLSQLAEDAGGLAAFISQGDNFERQAQAFRRKLMHPAVANLRFDIQGVGVYDIEPQKLPDLYHGSPVRIYGRYRQSELAKVTVSGVAAGQAIAQTVQLDFSAQEDANPEIERMWAWHKVQRLPKEADRQGSRASVTNEIVRLGEGYSIMTEYTSFIVLENDAEYKRWKIDRRNELRIKRDRRQQKKLQDQLAELRAKSAQNLGPSSSTPPNNQAPQVQDQQLQQQQMPNQQRRVRNIPPPSRSQPQRSRSVDFDFGGGGGGGALDPITGGIALGLAGMAAFARRRKKNDPEA